MVELASTNKYDVVCYICVIASESLSQHKCRSHMDTTTHHHTNCCNSFSLAVI